MVGSGVGVRRFSMAAVQKGGSGLPNRCVFQGPEGAGKISFGSCSPKPIFLMNRGETGLLSLNHSNS
jgi:hypothetical protein